MAYINTQTNQYPVYESGIRAENPNTSFAVPFQAPEQYAPVLESPIPEYNRLTQTVREIAPTKDSLGNWMKTYEVVGLEAEQIAYNEAQAKQGNKQTAEQLLSSTDWVENPSVSDNTKPAYLSNFNEIMDYRMALRLIAINPPVTVEAWPEKPANVWATN